MNSQEILEVLKSYLAPLGLEVYLFKLGWYNKQVEESFKFPLNPDTVCSVILSTPSFFENAFLPFLKKVDIRDLAKDPIDSCIAYHVNQILNRMIDIENITMYDYELLPNRKPKVLVQTAAHVAGAAFYYQRKHVCEKNCVSFIERQLNDSSESTVAENNSALGSIMIASKNVPVREKELIDPWDNKKRVFGVSIHPLYGGWFAMRCVIIFKNVIEKDLTYHPPTNCVPSRMNRIKLLNKFNDSWQDWTYRDVIPVKEKYSELQQKYFLTPPKNRLALLSELGYI